LLECLRHELLQHISGLKGFANVKQKHTHGHFTRAIAESVAPTRRKSKWSGGMPVLGYDAETVGRD